MNTAPVLLGFVTSLGLIVAIGAQNAFVLRQGLRREGVTLVVAFCALSDAVLIALGVAGLGWLGAALPALLPGLLVAGVGFLLLYGLQAAKRAWRPGASGLHAAAAASGPTGALRILAQAAAFTWLNPHAWLDTTVLVGSLAQAQGPEGRWLFALGAMTASLCWFTTLAWAARRLAPLFARPQAWRALDALIAATMFTLAWGLARGALDPSSLALPLPSAAG